MRVKQKQLSRELNFLRPLFFKGSLGILFLIEFFVSVNANTLLNKKQCCTLSNTINKKGILLNSKNTSTFNLSDRFEDAYFMYSRPMDSSIGLGSQIAEILSILIGGRSKPKFMGIGYKVDAMKKESIAIEDLYRKALLPKRKEFKFNNPDIDSGYCRSILFDECI